MKKIFNKKIFLSAFTVYICYLTIDIFFNLSDKSNKDLSESEGKIIYHMTPYYLKIATPIYISRIYKNKMKFEEHKIQTIDGYILTCWRIPGKQTELTRENERQPIILQHGLLDSSYGWIFFDSDKLLVYQLIEEGYDVWIPNSRGNIFSKEHVNYTHYDYEKQNSKFWDFSFHEMAVYDLKAIVGYIKYITSADKISYIGHSQGSAIFFVSYMTDPEFINNNIKAFASLGTIGSVFSSVTINIYYNI
jgi:pimeloyl-ACP methyl ester carboxylesterase